MIAGVNSSLTQNHYEDDVRSVTEFLQDAFSKVTSVENDRKGNSEKAIYGKFITFGEAMDFSGNTTRNNGTIFIYDVVGDIAETDTGNTIESLRNLNAKVTRARADNPALVEFAGVADTFQTRWGSTIEKTDVTTGITADVLKAGLLIVRSPATGSIFTYVIPYSTIVANSAAKIIEINTFKVMDYSESDDRLLNALNNNLFSIEDLDICINMEHKVYGGKRKNIRVKAMARSSADVQVIPLDSADNRCK